MNFTRCVSLIFAVMLSIPVGAAPLFPGEIFPVAGNPVAVASADFNGDGFVDMAVATEGSSVISVLLNDGSKESRDRS